MKIKRKAKENVIKSEKKIQSYQSVWVISAPTLVWSAFAEIVRILTFLAKLVKKKSKFTMQSQNFMFSVIIHVPIFGIV